MTDESSQNRQFAGFRNFRSAGPDSDGASEPGESERLGRYQIVAELGRGAMGLVYEARDPRIKRVVAIKIITIAGAGADEAEAYRTRFVREAQAAGRLTHPGIVTIYDVDQDPGSGTPYIVMEFVPGKRLDTFVAESPNQRLSLETSLALAQQIAEALDYAHSQGIVHRDIKPGNIIVTSDGRAKIADFGIAKISLTEFTVPGQVLGTPAFMAPEQLLEGTADGRSDLFSLGVILYWMLTGEKPFTGDSAASISFKVVYKDPTPVTEVSPNLHPKFDAILRRALAKDPAARYQTGNEFALDLKNLQATAPAKALKAPGRGTEVRIAAQAAVHSAVKALQVNAVQGAIVATRWLKEIRMEEVRIPEWRSRIRQLDLKWRIAIMGVAVILLGGIGFHKTKPAAPAEPIVASSLPAAPVVVVPETTTSISEPVATETPHKTKPKPVRDRKTNQSAAGDHRTKKSAPEKTKAPALLAASAPAVPRTPEPVASVVPERTLLPSLKVQPVAHSTLLTVGEHPFRSMSLSISLDGELAYKAQLTGVRKLPFGSTRGTISAAIPVTPGSHVVEVHVESQHDHCDETKKIEGQFQADQSKTVEIKFTGHDLQLDWK